MGNVVHAVSYTAASKVLSVGFKHAFMKLLEANILKGREEETTLFLSWFFFPQSVEESVVYFSNRCS